MPRSMDTSTEDGDSFVSNADAMIYGTCDISGWTQSLISDPNIVSSSTSCVGDHHQQQQISTAASGGIDDLVVSCASSSSQRGKQLNSDVSTNWCAGDAESCSDVPPMENEVPALQQENVEPRVGVYDEHNLEIANGEHQTREMMCKSCSSRISSVFVMPCRHLCMCKTCEPLLRLCPVCKLVSTASVQLALETENGEHQKREMMCKICSSRKSCMVFLPCRHLSLCKACALLLHSCPVCKMVIQLSIEVFI